MGRSSYTIEFKLKTTNRLTNEFSGNISKASTALGIARKMLRDWCKNEVKMANLGDKRRRRYATGGRGAKYPLLEKQLVAWFREQRQSKIIFNKVNKNHSAFDLKRHYNMTKLY